MLRNERCSQIGQLYVTEILSPLTQMDRLRTMILWFGRQHRTGVPLNHITKAVFLGRDSLNVTMILLFSRTVFIGCCMLTRLYVLWTNIRNLKL